MQENDIVLSFALSIHNALVPLVLLAGGVTLICGVALFLVYRSNPAGSAGLQRVFRALLSVTAAIGVLQAIFGGILVLLGARPNEGLHFVYGLIVLGAIPVAYVYSDQNKVRRDIIIMTIAAVAFVGAAFRAWATGPAR